MKNVTLAVALTGSCALFYLLYNMKQKSKERLSKNRIKCSQFEMNKSKSRNEEDATKSILHPKDDSKMHGDELTSATESNSELTVVDSLSESATIVEQNDHHSKVAIDGRDPKSSDVQLGTNFNEMCSTNLSALNVHSSIRGNDLPSKGSETYSNYTFTLPSGAGFQNSKDDINEVISESSSRDTVENLSSKCPNIFKTEIEVNKVNINSLSITDADECSISVSTVPEKICEDGCQISLQQECLSNNSNILSALNESEPKFDAFQDCLEKLEGCVSSLSIDCASVSPALCDDASIRSVPSNVASIPVLIKEEQLLTLQDECTTVEEAPKDERMSGLVSEQNGDSSIFGAKEPCEPVSLVAKIDPLLAKDLVDDSKSKNCNITKPEMDPLQKSKKKQKLRGKKRAAKDPAIDPCIETLDPADAVKVSDFNSSKYLCDPNIKKGFWSASEIEGNFQNEIEQIESKVGAPSPDHLCTSDLEREASQTPEHENITSDSQSLASFDSGQGSIEQETIFSNMLIPEANSDHYITYQFEIPQTLVGKLIGKKGAFLSKIKAATSTNVIVVAHNDNKYKLCSIEGKKWQVLQALDLIREHFPAQKFPELCLDQINVPSPQHQPQINRQLLQVELPPGVVLEVQTSSIISTGEVWLQQPLHPTFSALQRLHQCLNLNYGDGSSTPSVPLTTPAGTVCVCQIGDQWLRCQLEEHDDDSATVCLLDVGGYVSLPITLLRQIRMDYASLPFQASRCYLYGIEPNSDDGWDEEGRSALLQLCNNTIIFATIAAYSEDGIPLVNLYQRHFNQYTFINEEIVKMNHAKWISTPAFTEST